MKIKALLLASVMVAGLLVGCGSKQSAPAQAPAPKADATASASVTSDPDVFTKAISKDGKWIIAITKDMTLDKDLVLEGEFKNGKKDDSGKELLQRMNRERRLRLFLSTELK